MKDISSKSKNELNNEHIKHFRAQEFMDDGSSLNILIKVDVRDGSATFDLTGTSYQVNGNLNAPRAITLSAIIYCLRCMLNYDIPLNQVVIFLILLLSLNRKQNIQ
jgi:N-methylhydantoinase B/oxoprolinase/acetone carboxylase alpha subunit